ncbi:hypothetical protein [Haloferula sp. A504]|uniref:hypothetical protein n=1 Tax=Haloferula sp. A504 TaxID=3373601 RepID=UPI0031C64079|nr:hypothetical protein [Verrucomicrobiaceae bacterium E54]
MNWELSGLKANFTYDLIFYGGGPPRPCLITISGANSSTDSEGDVNFTSVTSDGDGKISGTWNQPSGTSITNWGGLEVAEVPLPSPLQLVIRPSETIPGSYNLEWFPTRDDKVYDLLSSTDLSTAPSSWLPWEGHINIPGTATTNSLPGVPGGDDDRRFFAVLEKDPPLPALVNAGFEDPVLNDGDFGGLDAPWVEVNVPFDGTIEAWNPTISEYPATVDYPNGVPDPENVCSIYHFPPTPPGAPFGIRQTLDRTYALGTDYTLTVQVGRVASTSADPFDWPGFRVELWAGATLLASDEDPTTTAPTPGTFITSTVSYDHNTGPVATVGDALEVRLLSRGQDVAGDSGNGWSVEFDQVEFTENAP